MEYIDLLHKDDTEGLNEYLEKHIVNGKYKGQSLLYWAVHMNNIQFTKQLIHRGANVNHRDCLGRTPLLIACYFGYFEIASFLMENGADMTGCLERAEVGWDNHKQKEIIELLKQRENK